MLIFENKKGIRALISSRDYIKGDTLKTGGMLAIFIIAISAIRYALGYIFIKQVDYGMIYVLLNLLIMPIYTLFTYNLYCYQRANKQQKTKEISQKRLIKYRLVAIFPPFLIATVLAIFLAFHYLI